MRKIALIGQQCAGKTSVADLLTEGQATDILKFAGPIYAALEALGRPKHREFMQRFGDLAKECFGEKVFVEAFRHNFQKAQDGDWPADLILCDDVRQSYEADAVKDLGFEVLFIDADEEVRRKRALVQGLEWRPNHSSETEVPELRPYADIVIENNADKKALLTKLEALGLLTRN